MPKKIVLALSVLAFVATSVTAIMSSADAAGDGKNLQVLSKDLTKKEIRALMKEVGKAVGKSCDECHDLEDFSKDGDMKKKAREMFKLTNSINSRLKKDGFKKRVKCVTCHAGDAVPKK